MNQPDLFGDAPRAKAPPKSDTPMLLAMDADYTTPAQEQRSRRMPEQLLSWTLKHSCHFHTGRSMYYQGEPRKLPPMFTRSTGKNPRDWFAGWDFGAVEDADQ